MTDRKPLDASAFSLMVVLTALWGLQQVIIKLTAPDVSLVMQAGVRSVVATGLVLGWAAYRRIALFNRDGTFWPGIAAGLLFVFVGGLAEEIAKQSRETRRRELLEEAALLEAQHASGEVGPKYRQTRRDEIVRELAVLLHQEKQQSHGESARSARVPARTESG